MPGNKPTKNQIVAQSKPRDSKGRFVSSKTGTIKTVSWADGAAGFFQWLDDVQPNIPSSKGGYELFKPTDEQRKGIEKALAQDKDGNFIYQTIVWSFPRRHSKTILNILLVLWRFCTREGENIKIMANSERQTLSVGFKLAKQIVLNTPALRTLIGAKNVRTYDIRYPKLDNLIQAVNCNVAGLYGEKITCAHVTEIHAAPDGGEAMQVMASSLGDTENSWLLVDSTCDAIGGVLHTLEQLAESGDDPTIYTNIIRYKDLAEALEKSPPWINRKWLKSRQKQLLPAVFETQHLNQRSSANNNLFDVKHIKACQRKWKSPLAPEVLQELAHGRKHLTGGGLDRAYFGSIHGDKTIWTAVAKVAGVDGDEPEWIVLNQKNVLGSLASGIKKAISKDMAQYGLQNIVVESYNSQDIYTWLLEQPGWNGEVIHPTNTAQLEPFMQLYRIVKEKRLHFGKNLKGLKEEMETFVYTLGKGGQPKFGSDKRPDDRVYG
jgi:hypothetical protein